MPIQGSLIGLPGAVLTDLQTQFVACLRAIATRGASYSIDGRSYTSADIAEVRDTLAEINFAIQQANGTRRNFMYAQTRSGY